MARKRTVKTAEKAATTPGSEAFVSNHERIALLAYKYWEERGRPAGTSQEDWFRAEREILEQLAGSKQFRQG
jgi:ribonuclease I